jgi:hypothetical protein
MSNIKEITRNKHSTKTGRIGIQKKKISIDV